MFPADSDPKAQHGVRTLGDGFCAKQADTLLADFQHVRLKRDLGCWQAYGHARRNGRRRIAVCRGIFPWHGSAAADTPSSVYEDGIHWSDILKRSLILFPAHIIRHYLFDKNSILRDGRKLSRCDKDVACRNDRRGMPGGYANRAMRDSVVPIFSKAR